MGCEGASSGVGQAGRRACGRAPFARFWWSVQCYVRTDAGGTLPNVKKVAIIADGSAPVPYTTIVSHVMYAGQSVTP